MVTRTTFIVNKTGLHARPASDFVAMAKKFKSDIKIKNITSNDSKDANAKSIFAVLALGMVKGTEVQITAEGEDESEAVTELVNYIDNCTEL